MSRRLIILIITICLFSFIYISIPQKTQTINFQRSTENILIAHAGGGLKSGTYSNSLEAIELAVTNGFEYIEVDFLQTQNGDWVLMHDWDKTHLKYFSRFPRLSVNYLIQSKSAAKSAIEFKSRSMRYELTPLSLTDLVDWLGHNPNVRIITDVKGNNRQALALIKSMMGDNIAQIIPQIYSASEYNDIFALGYKDIIFTAYRSSMGPSELKAFCDSHDLFALTIPKGWITQPVSNWLGPNNLPVFTHTVNSQKDVEVYNNFGVSGYYTDYLTPQSP